MTEHLTDRERDLLAMAKAATGRCGTVPINPAAIIDLITRLAEAREVVAKLPKTADGVAIVPGMTVWVPEYESDDGEDWKCLVTGVSNFNAAGCDGDGEESFYTAGDDCHPDCDRATRAKWAYSSYAAALAARSPAAGGGEQNASRTK